MFQNMWFLPWVNKYWNLHISITSLASMVESKVFVLCFFFFSIFSTFHWRHWDTVHLQWWLSERLNHWLFLMKAMLLSNTCALVYSLQNRLSWETSRAFSLVITRVPWEINHNTATKLCFVVCIGFNRRWVFHLTPECRGDCQQRHFQGEIEHDLWHASETTSAAVLHYVA